MEVQRADGLAPRALELRHEAKQRMRLRTLLGVVNCVALGGDLRAKTNKVIFAAAGCVKMGETTSILDAVLALNALPQLFTCFPQVCGRFGWLSRKRKINYFGIHEQSPIMFCSIFCTFWSLTVYI
jgi:hypothetical protein